MADNQEIIDWPAESIPSQDTLYMRVHRAFTKDGDFLVGAFRDQGGGMSTEWDKYSTAGEVQSRAKAPIDNGAIQMTVSDVVAIEPLVLRHTPDIERRVRGHCDVIGTKTPEVRVKPKRIARWAIALVPG